MRKLFLSGRWEYEVLKNEGEGIKGYGYHLNIYKNDILVFENGAFGSISIAEINARDYFLLMALGVEREYY